MLGALSTQFFKGLFILTFVFALSACGGGGSGGDTAASSSSAPSLTANAGADKTVNAGDRIDLKSNILVVGGTGFRLANGNLEVEGASSTAKDIVFASWTKTEGPAIALGSSGTTAAEAYFIAPSTGTANSIKITYKLTIKTVDGTTAEDSVTFTVNRVNVLPTANAGPDATADSGATVALKGVGTDTDGTITGYSWTQTAGETVQLTGNSTGEASFVAPDVSSETNFEFTLSVTDNDGGKTSDSIIVHVVPGNAPRVEIHFPPVGGIYTESTISAFGTVTAKTGKVNSLIVTSGSSEITVVPDSAGNWRAESIDLPNGAADVSIQVVAIDSNGNTGKATSNLKTSGEGISDYIGLGSYIGLAVDSAKKVAYVLTKENEAIKTELFPIDLSTGKKGTSISTFSNTNQGMSVGALTTLSYAPQKNLIYVGSAPINGTSKIISIDTTTGMRSLVSGDNKGTGTQLNLPYGLAVGAGSTLYVADNLNNTIVGVNTETGDRTTVADNNKLVYPIDAPSLLAMNNSEGAERLFILANSSPNYVLRTNPLVNTFTHLVTFGADSSQGLSIGNNAQGFALDPSTNTLFIAENIGGIIKVDIPTGNREKLMDSSSFRTKITYDAQRHLLYLLDGAPTNLFVADPITGQKVQISRDN